ncbi:MAG: hypothetical protein FWD22_00270, partial [Treponema sp.]|nr:hypothetical protein [Treponema sp.]
MEAIAPVRRKLHLSFHFERQRLNNLLMQAIKYPLVLICAGAGYGKTTAVHDFVHEYQATTVWIQLSERDNVGSRFWENFIHTMTKAKPVFAKLINKIGFPDTEDKLNQYHTILRENVTRKRRIIVFDDCHLIENPAVIRFIESAFHNMPVETSFFMISRSTPRINLARLVSKGHIFNISEDELRFTENELTQYFRQLEIFTQPGDGYPMETVREIMQDTDGWAFAINLIARSFQKAPAYTGYLRTAMKTNVFRFMETEIWDGISVRLQLFLIQLSLIDHLSVDIITLLTGTDTALTDELERQNAYVRRDSYINAYLIHPLFLEFLATKQSLLSQEQKHKTYSIAADWCNKNGFKLDALSYYEKVGDYEAIVSIFFELPTQIPLDIARYAKDIFDKIPEEAFEQINFLAVIHIRTIMGLGLLQEAFKLAESYEAKILKLPDENPNKGYTLGGIYY